MIFFYLLVPQIVLDERKTGIIGNNVTFRCSSSFNYTRSKFRLDIKWYSIFWNGSKRKQIHSSYFKNVEESLQQKVQRISSELTIKVSADDGRIYCCEVSVSYSQKHIDKACKSTTLKIGKLFITISIS